MASKNNKSTGPEGREFAFTRTFTAPRSLVFKVWTEPKHVAQWWGPHGFTNPVCEVDAKPGGALLIHMCGPDGTRYPMTGVYQEVVEPERLSFTSSALDPQGRPLFEVLTSVTFAENQGKTAVRVRTRILKATAESAPYLEGMEAGWKQTLERLEAYATRAAHR